MSRPEPCPQYSVHLDGDSLAEVLNQGQEWLKTMQYTFGNLHVENFKVDYIGFWFLEITLTPRPILLNKHRPISYEE